MNLPFRLKFGDAFWRYVLRPYLFGKEAEDAHLSTIRALKRMQGANLLWILRLLYRSPYCEQPIKVFGVPWRNPVGLAAGFDKQAEVIPALEALGYGSAEIGTAPPRPQFGNERPRVFRYPQIGAIINRYGFNSVGTSVIAGRLVAPTVLAARSRLPLGISIGKNKETPDDAAAADYLAAFRHVLPVLRKGDWVKVNISSPNTPKLRELFSRLDEFLGTVVEGAREFAADIEAPLPPLVLKVPPDDLTPDQLSRVVEVAAKYGFSGIEATNTTTDEGIKRWWGLAEAGGVSGEPLRELATQRLRDMRDTAREHRLDLVGVGGISQAWHAEEKCLAGARAVQIYTGLVFRGPILVHEILERWR